MGRKLKFPEERSSHTIRTTDAAWKRAQEVAAFNGCAGVSELIELIGRDKLFVIKCPTPLDE